MKGIEKTNNQGKLPETKFDFTRHSKASYETYSKILASDDPLASFNPEDQIFPDLLTEGVELARRSAVEYFDALGPSAPKDTALIFVSSNEARAQETAEIYLAEAKVRGFEVLTVEKKGEKPAPRGRTDEILLSNALSINARRGELVIQALFFPDGPLPDINWRAIKNQAASGDGLAQEILDKWETARQVVLSDDQGSWGSNAYLHAQALKQFFPDFMKSPDDLFGAQFQRMARLVNYAQRQIEASAHPKGVQVLAFGHEDYLGSALQLYTGVHGIENCETVSMVLQEDGTVIPMRTT